jgi:predicted nucleic acid-binding protein
MTEKLLFDTYALMELLNKNSNYEKYLDKGLVINDFIFAEFCYQLIKNKDRDINEHLNEIGPAIIRINPNIIRRAMNFRYKNKKKKLSMTDCISYLQAKELNIKFLTGDKEFESLENVEFVK